MRKSQFVTSIQCQLVEKPLIFTQLGQFRTSIHPNIRTTALGTEKRKMKVFLFFLCLLGLRPFEFGAELVQSVAVWQTYLWSAIIAVAISCFCLIIVFENRFSAIISQIQTIYDCNRLPSVCSNLLQPFDPRKIIRVGSNITQ